MNFYFSLKHRYALDMDPKEFDAIINDLESDLFIKHPDYLKLPVSEQNKRVEEAYRAKYGNNAH